MTVKSFRQYTTKWHNRSNSFQYGHSDNDQRPWDPREEKTERFPQWLLAASHLCLWFAQDWSAGVTPKPECRPPVNVAKCLLLSVSSTPTHLSPYSTSHSCIQLLLSISSVPSILLNPSCNLISLEGPSVENCVNSSFNWKWRPSFSSLPRCSPELPES